MYGGMLLHLERNVPNGSLKLPVKLGLKQYGHLGEEKIIQNNSIQYNLPSLQRRTINISIVNKNKTLTAEPPKVRYEQLDDG